MRILSFLIVTALLAASHVVGQWISPEQVFPQYNSFELEATLKLLNRLLVECICPAHVKPCSIDLSLKRI